VSDFTARQCYHELGINFPIMTKLLAKGSQLAGSLAFLVVLNSGSAQAGSNSGVYIDKPVVIGDITFNNSIVKLDVVSASFTRAFGFDAELALVSGLIKSAPWWGNATIAQEIAESLYTDYYTDVTVPVAPIPQIPYGLITSLEDDLEVPMVQFVQRDSDGSYEGMMALTETAPWLRAVEVRAISVPGPVPLFGAAAAFGWSRRLRRSIDRGV
jgi:hypothetical protein